MGDEGLETRAWRWEGEEKLCQSEKDFPRVGPLGAFVFCVGRRKDLDNARSWFPICPLVLPCDRHLLSVRLDSCPLQCPPQQPPPAISRSSIRSNDAVPPLPVQRRASRPSARMPGSLVRATVARGRESRNWIDVCPSRSTPTAVDPAPATTSTRGTIIFQSTPPLAPTPSHGPIAAILPFSLTGGT